MITDPPPVAADAPNEPTGSTTMLAEAASEHGNNSRTTDDCSLAFGARVVFWCAVAATLLICAGLVALASGVAA